MKAFVTSHQTVRGAAVMWWFSPRPRLLPSGWKECCYRRPTRRPISCSYGRMLQSSDVKLQQDAMYFHREHPIYVFVHISVCSCVWSESQYLCCIPPCVPNRAYNLVFESLVVSTRGFLPLKMNFPVLYLSQLSVSESDISIVPLWGFLASGNS